MWYVLAMKCMSGLSTVECSTLGLVRNSYLFKLERAHNYLFYWVVILSFLPSSKLVPWFSLSFFPFGGKAHDIYLMTRLRGPAVFFTMYSIINSSLYKLWDTSHRIPKLRIVSGYHAVYLSLVTKYWKTCLDLRINICF